MAGQAYAVFVDGLASLQQFEQMKDSIRLNAIRAINRTAATTRTSAADRILQEVNFPRSYLSPSDRRFFVSRQASGSKLEAAITARSRPTSLARFIVGNPGKVGAQVAVTPGHTVSLPRAFVVRLPAGSGPIDTNSNRGLAVRLKKGAAMRNKISAVRMRNGLYLLYGPSVQQVFINNKGEGIANDMSDEILDKLEEEFLRLMDR